MVLAEMLWTAGSPIAHLVIIISGEVRVIRESGGRRHVLHTEGAGGTLGEVPFYSGGVAPATAMATVPTQCLMLGRDAIEAAIAVDPATAWVLLDRLARRVRTLVERVDRLAVQTAEVRLVGLLISRPQVAEGIVDIGMSQAALAAELGTVREVVVRVLRSLRQRGLIATDGPRRIRILDPAGLRKAIEPAQ